MFIVRSQAAMCLLFLFVFSIAHSSASFAVGESSVRKFAYCSPNGKQCFVVNVKTSESWIESVGTSGLGKRLSSGYDDILTAAAVETKWSRDSHFILTEDFKLSSGGQSDRAGQSSLSVTDAVCRIRVSIPATSPSCVSFSPDGMRVAASDQDAVTQKHVLIVWKPSFHGKQVSDRILLDGQVDAIAWIDNNRIFAVTSPDSEKVDARVIHQDFFIVDCRTNTRIRVPIHTGFRIFQLAPYVNADGLVTAVFGHRSLLYAGLLDPHLAIVRPLAELGGRPYSLEFEEFPMTWCNPNLCVTWAVSSPHKICAEFVMSHPSKVVERVYETQDRLIAGIDATGTAYGWLDGGIMPIKASPLSNDTNQLAP